LKRIASKNASGRKMRVTAAFTSVAAVATTFTPVFATAAHASSLREAACTTSRETWLHIRSAYFHSHEMCWGFKGGRSIYPPALGYNQECGGNNHGFIIWSNVTTGHKAIGFHQGTTYATYLAYSEVAGVHISGWSGNDKC
jgi:hypothetical protein